MSEEINEEVIENTENGEPKSLAPDFKRACLRIGAMMIVVFAVRCVSTILLSLTKPLYNDWSSVAKQLLEMVASIVFLNVIPITAGIFILKFPLKSGVKAMYSKPRYFGRALGIFPAGYGLAMAVGIITVLVGMLFKNTSIEESFNVTRNIVIVPDMQSAIVWFVHAVVVAPLFEEFWFRGMVLQTLKPYGNGFAIFVSGILFGLTHANLQQFFFTSVIGIVLGYVAVQTGSIITTTVIHAMFNSIAATSSLFLANSSVQDYILEIARGNNPEKSPVVVVYLIWNTAVILFAVVGFFMAIYKLAHIRRYRVPKVQTEMSTGKRWGIFLLCPTVIVMLLLAFDTMTFRFITQKIIDLIVDIFY